MPREKDDWDELPVRKVFGIAGTYPEGVEDIEESMLSHTDNQDWNKQHRLIRPKRELSSLEEELSDNENVRSIVVLPKQEQLMLNRVSVISTPIEKKYKAQETGFHHDIAAHNKCVGIEDAQFSQNTENNNFDCDIDFKKEVLWKLNTILQKIISVENRLEMLENSSYVPSHTSNPQQIGSLFPIRSLAELQYIEEQLQEKTVWDNVVNFLALIGGLTPTAMIRNVFKKILSDRVAELFSWAGRKNKQSFKDMNLSTIIIQAVQKMHPEVTESDIIEYSSKWLAQATVRLSRERLQEKQNIPSNM